MPPLFLAFVRVLTKTPHSPQGTADNFYKQGQLLPENFEKAVKETGVKGVKVRYHEV